MELSVDRLGARDMSEGVATHGMRQAGEMRAAVEMAAATGLGAVPIAAIADAQARPQG